MVNPLRSFAQRTLEGMFASGLEAAIEGVNGNIVNGRKNSMSDDFVIPQRNRHHGDVHLSDTSKYVTIEDGDAKRDAAQPKVDYMDISDVNGGNHVGDKADKPLSGDLTPHDDDDEGKHEKPDNSANNGTTDAHSGIDASSPKHMRQDNHGSSEKASESADAGSHDDDVARLKGENEKLRGELEKAKGSVASAERQRDQAYADLANYKRRSKDEMRRAREGAISDVGKSVMPAIDDLERVIAQYSDEDGMQAVASGCEGIRKKLLAALSNIGIEQIDPTGKEFNPDTSMAIAHEQHDGIDSNVVYETYQRGYKIGDKVIRTAMVGVAK